MALIRAGLSVKLSLKGDEAIGYDIIKRAISAPLKQIAENAGFDAGVVVNEVQNSKKDSYGFDAASGEYVDMLEKGIIDPLKVARIALQNAVSVSSMLLTTEATINEAKEDKPAPAMPDMGGMGGDGRNDVISALHTQFVSWYAISARFEKSCEASYHRICFGFGREIRSKHNLDCENFTNAKSNLWLITNQ